jgi:hypothetical protein
VKILHVVECSIHNINKLQICAEQSRQQNKAMNALFEHQLCFMFIILVPTCIPGCNVTLGRMTAIAVRHWQHPTSNNNSFIKESTWTNVTQFC